MENPDLVLQETGLRPTYSRLNYVPSGDTLHQDAISSLGHSSSFKTLLLHRFYKFHLRHWFLPEILGKTLLYNIAFFDHPSFFLYFSEKRCVKIIRQTNLKINQSINQLSRCLISVSTDSKAHHPIRKA